MLKANLPPVQDTYFWVLPRLSSYVYAVFTSLQIENKEVQFQTKAKESKRNPCALCAPAAPSPGSSARSGCGAEARRGSGLGAGETPPASAEPAPRAWRRLGPGRQTQGIGPSPRRAQKHLEPRPGGAPHTGPRGLGPGARTSPPAGGPGLLRGQRAWEPGTGDRLLARPAAARGAPSRGVPKFRLLPHLGEWMQNPCS